MLWLFDERAGAPLSGIWVIVLVFIGMSTQRVWVSLIKLEPEGDQRLKRKHRKFQAVVAALIIVALACAIGLGAALGSR